MKNVGERGRFGSRTGLGRAAHEKGRQRSLGIERGGFRPSRSRASIPRSHIALLSSTNSADLEYHRLKGYTRRNISPFRSRFCFVPVASSRFHRLPHRAGTDTGLVSLARRRGTDGNLATHRLLDLLLSPRSTLPPSLGPADIDVQVSEVRRRPRHRRRLFPFFVSPLNNLFPRETP